MAGGTGDRLLLRRPSFFALWLGGGLNYAVTPAVLVVLVWEVTQGFPGVSGPAHARLVALTLALLGLSATLPTLAAATVAGTLADMFPRKSLLRAVNAAQTLAVLGLVFDLAARPLAPLDVPGIGGAVPLYLVLLLPFYAVSNTAATLFRPALNASLPRVVAPSELGRANGLVLSFALALSFAASLIAPAVLELEGAAVALLLPIGFLVLAQGSFTIIRDPLDAPSPRPRRAFRTELIEGYRYLAQQPALLRLTLAGLSLNFLSNLAFVELGLYVTITLGATQAVYLGVLYAGANVGAAVGSYAVARLAFEPRAGRYLIVLAFGQGLTVLVLAFVRWYPLAAVDLFLYGLVPGMAVTVFYAIVQAIVPNDRLGRVLAADEVGSLSFLPTGQYVGGLVTLEFGVTTAFGIAGIGILLTGLGMAASRSVRELGFRPHRAPPPGATGADPGAAEPPG